MLALRRDWFIWLFIVVVIGHIIYNCNQVETTLLETASHFRFPALFAVKPLFVAFFVASQLKVLRDKHKRRSKTFVADEANYTTS